MSGEVHERFGLRAQGHEDLQLAQREEVGGGQGLGSEGEGKAGREGQEDHT